MSAHVKEAPLTVDKEYVADLAVTASAKGQVVTGARLVPLRDDGVATHSAVHLPQAADQDTPPVGSGQATRADTSVHTAMATIGQLIAAVLIAVAVSVVALAAISTVRPAFPSSNQFARVDHCRSGWAVCWSGRGRWLWRRRSGAAAQWTARLGAAVFLSAFTVVTIGMPLGATKLYLFGISVDQQFRTEYLTWLADSPDRRAT